MALTVTSRGSGATTTGTTTAALTGRSATLAAGSLGVLCIALDNAGSAGATEAAPTSATDSKGNVWTRVADGIYDNGAASAGIEGAIYTAPIITALLTTDTLTLTWIGGVTVASKAWTWYEVIPSAGNYATFLSGAFGTGATAANGQITTASVAVGNAVIAGYFSENVAAVTGDADSTNGSWTAQQTQTVGATTSGVRIATQQKVQTTTPGTQSYDVTVSSQDRIVGYVIIAEQASNRNGLVVATGGGVAAEVGRKGATLAVASTGGGVNATVGRKGGLGATTATGGGVSAEAGTTNRSLALTATGAGVLTWDYAVASVENHDGAFAVTGGGVTGVAAATARLAAFASSGGGVEVTTASTQRNGAVAAAGGGVAVPTAESGRNGALVAAGGGVASVSAEAGRLLAAALSGGGVIAATASSERFSDLTATGGGSATLTGTSGEAHDGAIAVTGGGVGGFGISTERLVELAATAAGAAVIAGLTARLGAMTATGGGVFTVTGGAFVGFPRLVKATIGAPQSRGSIRGVPQMGASIRDVSASAEVVGDDRLGTITDDAWSGEIAA